MRLLSIEPTPSPNAMKLNLDRKLPVGAQHEYTKANSNQAPAEIQKLLDIQGVTSVFHTADFLSLERKPNADWQSILTQVRAILEGSAQSGAEAPPEEVTSFGEVHVFIQMFREIPWQVKVTSPTEHVRIALSDRFSEAATKASSVSTNLILERKWIEQGVRYGEVKEIAEEVAQEIEAAYDQERLHALVEAALQSGEAPVPQAAEKKARPVVTLEMFDQPDWQKRYALLEQMEPTEEQIPVLAKALEDSKQSIRRLATVLFGMIGGKTVLPYLYRALKDQSVSVRRTAGDTLSDLGDPEAIGAMADALKDPNKLVRWRAARFLYEIGDESSLAALREAQDDPEFEVRLQIKMALERIESGEAASGTVWQQMTRRND
ncbi:virulence factor [Brevibacillus sp. SYSU BS000544]|uniref:virulence factor n=1 Tax=Brevibacillus sp. SYSU BS000544 TaxID=3416443 RepID=UPI003CE4A1F1